MLPSSVHAIDRHIAKGIVTSFGLALGFASIAVLLLQAQRLIGASIGFGIQPLDIVVIFLAALPPFLVPVIPIAYLFAVCVSLGRLAIDRELIAMMFAGASPWRIARVPVALGLTVSVATLPVAHVFEPYGMRVLYSRLTDVALRNISHAFVPGIVNEAFVGLAFYAGGRDGDALTDVFVSDARDPHRPVLIVAKRGELSASADGNLAVRLKDGEIHLEQGDVSRPSPYERARFGRLELVVDAAQEVWEKTRLVSESMRMTSGEMRAAFAHAPADDVGTRRIEKSYWRRFALPMMAFVFSVAATAIVLRFGDKNRTRIVVLSMALVVGYYVLMRAGDLLVLHRENSAFIAAFGPDLVTLLVGSLLLTHAGKPR